jgi:hypothetical protein
MTEADLDALDMAKQDEWWRILNTIVTRIESRSATMDRPGEETA